MPTIKDVRALARRKPWQARIQLRCLSGRRVGWLACAALLGTLAIAPGAAAAAAGVDITAVEGQSFTGNVVDGLVCPLASATISWGDGTTSAGTSDGSTGIQGTHTYAEEGTYAGSVSYTYPVIRSCPSGTQTASFQATVQDAPLTWLGRNLTGTAGQSVSGVVAHFSDANPAAGAGDFSAQITWGDGTSSPGSVSAVAGGGFDVSGSHAYVSAGNYMVSVAVADAGGSTATTSSTAQIAAAPPPPPQLAARFVVNPSSPCPLTKTLLDARASILVPGATSTAYGWDIPGTIVGMYSFGDPVFDATDWLPYEIKESRYLGQVTHAAPGFPPTLYSVWIMHLLSPPVQVTLDVTQDVPGRGLIGDTQVRTITFRNPDVTLKLGFPGNGYGQPPVWILNPQQQRGCPRVTNRLLFGVKAVKGSVGLARLAAHSPVVLSSGRSIKLQVGCKNLVRNCLASLDVLSGAPKLSRRQRTLPSSIGTRTFVVSAGKTITVTVPLNARGRALAHAHHLHQVTLLLGSVGALGKTIPTIRTVRLLTGR